MTIIFISGIINQFLVMELINDIEFMEKELLKCLLQSFKNRKCITEHELVLAAKPTVEDFISQQLFSIGDVKRALMYHKSQICTYFPTIAASSKFLETIDNLNQVATTSSTQPTDSFEFNLNPDELEQEKANESTSSHSQIARPNYNQIVDIKPLFQSQTDLRELYERLSTSSYQHGSDKFKKDYKLAAKIVYNDLKDIQKSLPENVSKSGIKGISFPTQKLKNAAISLVRAFPCTKLEIEDKDSEGEYRYFSVDSEKKTQRSGYLFTLLQEDRNQEFRLQQQRTATQPQSVTPKKKQATYFSQKRQIDEIDSGDDSEEADLRDPLCAGLLTLQENFDTFFNDYYEQLIVQERRKDVKAIKRCYALFAYNGRLVSIHCS